MFFRQEARNIWLSFFLCFSHLPVALDSSLSCTHEFRRLDFLGKVTHIPSVLVNLIAVQRVLKIYHVDNTVFERQQLGRRRASEERHEVTQRLEKPERNPFPLDTLTLPATSKKPASSFVNTPLPFPNSRSIQGSQKKTLPHEANSSWYGLKR